MQRRNFIYISALGSLGLSMPLYSCKNAAHNGTVSTLDKTTFETLSFDLLKTWCDGMIRDQIQDPNDPLVDGALYCHACELIHGRCMDAVYPFLYMADHTGEQQYLDAALKVMAWSVNVDKPDGSWTVMSNPKSWNGTTVFGAIALGEALHHHRHILPKEIKENWEQRLKKAAEFIYTTFDMNFSHINYRFTAIYALYFLGNYFNEEKYVKRSREFAAEIPNWLTTPNKLLFGEDNPDDEKSAKGLYPVDLGYNVEETLNGVVQYAVLEEDEQLLELLTESMNAHLEFMLPDGGWDNSWGTRQNKWTYWGSRTTDGCQPAFSLMANHNPAFGTAAILSTELLQRCTVDGLLAGGLHYKTHGVKPCIHHTFAHAKNLAFVLDNADKIKHVDKKKHIPRAINDGVKHFTDLDVWIAARGPWRSTVSSYDQVWKKKYSVAATGGSLAVLWHEKVGPLFTASMAEYIEVEPYNQQEQPGEDFCITPRIERYVNGMWYTNIHDLKAHVAHTDKDGIIDFEINAVLTNREKQTFESGGNVQLNYLLDQEKTTIKAARGSSRSSSDVLVLPILSPTGEKVVQLAKNKIEIYKDGGTLVLESSAPITIKSSEKERIFNMVPGVEVVPVMINFPQEMSEILVTIRVV